MPTVTVTRLLRFNAAHRVHNPALSDAENAALFGKCNNPNWHGHNYILDVSVAGPVDARTGYVMDLGELKRVVQREIIDKVDHRNMNLEVPFMRGLIPIWRPTRTAAGAAIKLKSAPIFASSTSTGAGSSGTSTTKLSPSALCEWSVMPISTLPSAIVRRSTWPPSRAR